MKHRFFPLHITSLATLIALQAACSLRRDILPIGIYDVQKPEQIRPIAKAGFNAIHIAPSSSAEFNAFSREAHRHRISIVAYPDALAKESAARLNLRNVLAWDIQDEPEVWRIPPADLLKKSNRLRAWDPHHRQVIVIGKGNSARTFGHLADLLMLDWYPVPHRPINSVATELDEAISHTPTGKPIWMVVQAFDWRDAPQGNPNVPRIGRYPTESEMRYMAWLALAHNAQGLFFYTLNKPDGQSLLDFPLEWSRLREVVREIALLRPAISSDAGRRRCPWAMPQGVEAVCWRKGLRDYAAILNTGEYPQEVPISPTDWGGWRPLFSPAPQSGTSHIMSNGASRMIPPKEVLFFESEIRLFSAFGPL